MVASDNKSCLGRFLNNYAYWLLLVGVVSIAAYFRLNKLAQIPAGMTWDEAAIGYNGFAVWNTRRDEWLNFLPVSFQSFGDYKAPLAIYVSGLFTNFLGMNLMAVRLPFAMAGILAVAGMFSLYNQLAKLVGQEADRYRGYSLMLGFLIAFSPWHLHFSRAGFESGISLAFLIWGISFVLRLFNYLKNVDVGKAQFYFFSLGATLLLLASIYSYHSAKIVVPLLIIYLAWWQRRRWWHHKIKLLPIIALWIGGLWPLIKDALFEGGATRINTTILGQNNPITQILTQLFINLGHHLSPTFLVMGQTTTLRHGDGQWGVLFITTLLLCVFGLLVVIRNWRQSQTRRQNSIWLFSLIWIVAGLIPAAIGLEIPHSNRAMLALPGFLLLAVYGFESLLQVLNHLPVNKIFKGSHGEGNLLVKSVAGLIVFAHLIMFFSYWYDYNHVFAQASSNDFKEGYLEAFWYVIPYEKGRDGRHQVDKIVFTDYYGQPYIYALFARQTNPIWYRGGSLNKYDFHSVNVGDLYRQNTIVVAAGPEDTPPDQANKIIYGSDGSIRFKIYILNNKP